MQSAQPAEVLSIEDICSDYIEDYNKLNKKCDDVIIKIKTRKAKKKRSKPISEVT